MREDDAVEPVEASPVEELASATGEGRTRVCTLVRRLRVGKDSLNQQSNILYTHTQTPQPRSQSDRSACLGHFFDSDFMFMMDLNLLTAAEAAAQRASVRAL